MDAAEGYFREEIAWSQHGAKSFAAEATRRLALLTVLRGDVDEAERLLGEAGEAMSAPAGRLVRPIVEGVIARARGDLERSAEILAGEAARVPAGATMDIWDRVLIEAIVTLVALGRVDQATPMAERLRRMADL